MTNVELQQAKERFLELIELAASGEDVIISEGGKPFVKMSAVRPLKKQREFGSARGMIEMADDFDAPLEDFWEFT